MRRMVYRNKSCLAEKKVGIANFETFSNSFLRKFPAFRNEIPDFLIQTMVYLRTRILEIDKSHNKSSLMKNKDKYAKQ